MKKVSVLLVFTMIAMLVACNNPGGSDTDTASSPGAAETTPDISDDTAAQNGEQPDAGTPAVPPRPSNIDPNLSAQDVVSKMGVGWNLGNTFDAAAAAGSRLEGDIIAAETIWLGGAVNQTTQTLIQTVKNAGFECLRIPITWAKAADPDDDWKVREDWMERIKQVVDWALEEDMYVIINTHHDNAALQLGIDGADSEDHPGRQFLKSIWSQVSEVFIDYDERLIFEGMNEPRHEGGVNEWWGATQEVRDSINALNQAFVDTVRATGGSNAHRILMFTTHAAGLSPNGIKDVTLPDDPGNSVNKLVLSIHTYSPFNWAHDGIGSYGGAGDLKWDLDTAKETGDRLGVPVILGEWGSNHASMGNDPDQDLRNIQRPVHAEDYVRESLARGMVPFWWDNGGFTGTEHTWGIIRRNPPHEISDLHQEIIDAIMRAAGK